MIGTEMRKQFDKAKRRALIVLLFAFLPLILLPVLFERLETQMFLAEHSLLEDVSFSMGTGGGHTVKLVKDGYTEGNSYTAYIPSEYAQAPVILCPHATQILIDGKPYVSGDRLSGISEQTQYPIEVFSADTGERETGTITFFFGQNVPSLYVDTRSGSMESINSSPRHTYREAGTYVAVEANGQVSASGECTLKGRGNSTWTDQTAVKRPYNLETEDAVSLFGMSRQAKWSLLANCYDGSQLRSWLAYDVARKLDIPSAVETRFVNVYFNGYYNGLYLLTQHIDVTGGNVDIFDLNRENKKTGGVQARELVKELDEAGRFFSYYTGASPENISGGYLLEFIANTAGLMAYEEPWFQMDHNNALIEAPKYPTKAEVQYISDYMDRVEDSIFNATDDSYRQYLDFDSWVNMYYMREFFHAWDGENNSSYIYKDQDSDLLYNGPAWDYDFSMGQIWGAHAPYTAQCMWLESKAAYSWLQKLKTGHVDYAAEVERRYFDVFLPLVTEQIRTALPAQYQQIQKSAQMDYALYPVSVRQHYPGDFQEEYAYLLWWLQSRTDFFTDYLRNPQDYICFTIQSRNSFPCYVKPGTVITQLPTDNGVQCRWFYEDGTEVKVGDVIDRSLTILPENQQTS